MDTRQWHGTPNGYNNRGCRCAECRNAATEYARRRREARSETIPATCEICDSPPPLVWDHDHDTWKTRGWLCRKCNSGIGLLGDSAARLEAALRYLEGSK